MKKRIVFEDDYTQPELPHVLTPLFAKMFEDCEVRDANEVKFGEQFKMLYTGQVVVYENEGIKENFASFSHISTSIEWKEPKAFKVTMDTFGVYTLVNPPRLHKCPWGWRSPCFRPQVLVEGGKWREASDEECEAWSKILPQFRRVIYCIGVLGDDEDLT